MGAVLIVIPAAGASSRMGGRDKLLEEIDGTPILARQTARALATGAPVFVALSHDRPDRADALARLATPALTLTAIDGREGMAAALRAGARQAETQRAGGLMVLPADMPDLDTADLHTMLDAFQRAPGAIHRGASSAGQPGHPVIFPRRFFPTLQALAGDTGGRDLLRKETAHPVPLPGTRALTDLDTPDDWAAWRAARKPV
jgi:CTP:molybdopterin cytidylyltransferase MocA